MGTEAPRCWQLRGSCSHSWDRRVTAVGNGVTGLPATLLRITATATPHPSQPLVFCQYVPSVSLSQSRGGGRLEDADRRGQTFREQGRVGMVRIGGGRRRDYLSSWKRPGKLFSQRARTLRLQNTLWYLKIRGCS